MAMVTPSPSWSVLLAWADEKGALFYKGRGMMTGGCVLAVTDEAADAVHMITSGITARR
jgi:hypothetical protein